MSKDSSKLEQKTNSSYLIKLFSVLLAISSLVLGLVLYSTKYQNFEKYKIDHKSSKSKKYQVNLNLANKHELENLTGLGPKLADKVIKYRETHGRFHHIEDLMDVKGIGPKKFEKIKDYVTLEVNY